MVFSRQEYWSGLPFPSPRHLSDPGIEPGSLALQADPLVTELEGKPKEEEELDIYGAVKEDHRRTNLKKSTCQGEHYKEGWKYLFLNNGAASRG